MIDRLGFQAQFETLNLSKSVLAIVLSTILTDSANGAVWNRAETRASDYFDLLDII